MPLANFTPNQFRVHVFSSSSKRAREPQPNNYIIYSFDQGKRHKVVLFDAEFIEGFVKTKTSKNQRLLAEK